MRDVSEIISVSVVFVFGRDSYFLLRFQLGRFFSSDKRSRFETEPIRPKIQGQGLQELVGQADGRLLSWMYRPRKALVLAGVTCFMVH